MSQLSSNGHGWVSGLLNAMCACFCVCVPAFTSALRNWWKSPKNEGANFTRNIHAALLQCTIQTKKSVTMFFICFLLLSVELLLNLACYLTWQTSVRTSCACLFFCCIIYSLVFTLASQSKLVSKVSLAEGSKLWKQSHNLISQVNYDMMCNHLLKTSNVGK